jgi:plasmid replication initiation protein
MKKKHLLKKVVKSNALISAKYKQKYTLHEQKTILWILSQINENTVDSDAEYSLSIKDYAAALGIDASYIYQEAQNVASKLISKTLTIEENGQWIVCSWLAGMRYEKGTLYASIYPPLKPHLLALKSHFTTYQLQYTLILNSTYAIRIYELLAQYKKIGSRTIGVTELREMLGIEPNELKQFVDLRNRVLSIAQREINAKTDLSLSWQPIKTGRKISHIEFFITQKEQPSKNKGELSSLNDKQLQASLEKIGFSEKELAKLVKDFGEAKISEKYEYLMYQKKVQLPKQWLIKALVNDYNVADMNIEKTGTKQKEKIKKFREQELKVNEFLGALHSPLAAYDETFKKDYEKKLNEAKLKLEEMKKSLST